MPPGTIPALLVGCTEGFINLTTKRGKTMNRILLLLLSVLLILPVAADAGGGKNKRRHNNPNNDCNMNQLLEELPAQKLRKREINHLMYMREEEKLARDVYLTLYEEWDLRVIRNIAKAESKHMAAVLALIDKYELDDPVGDNAVGVFTNADLQALYEKLAASGTTSLIAALQVGATIEDVDIYDLQNAIEATNNADLQMLYQNLIKGSSNHLRAFNKLLVRYGGTYEPVYLSPEEYQAILDAPQVKGVLDANGNLICGGW